MDRDEHAIDAWLYEANEDLIEAIAAETNVEARLDQAKQAATNPTLGTSDNLTDHYDVGLLGQRHTPIVQDASLARITQRTAATPQRPTPSIGLITTIPEEFVAMRVLLDDSRDTFVPHDTAPYVLGTLASKSEGQSHNVVLTLLGATATNMAANGCANLIRSFPSVTVLIMVGIAAGVPNPLRPERHVRLGDIVVATEIVDFDHVRAVEGDVELRRPQSLPSPRLALGADMLRNDELSGLYPWEQWLDRAQHPEFVGYGRPPEHTDVLHDNTGWPLRHPRRDRSGHRKGSPKVHYGAIGSSHRSFSDVTVRDRLAAQHGIIALEMEGASIGSSSILNGREWFVVRGISDYGGSHRSALWRRYAALSAAAYVRALLGRCLPMTATMANPLDDLIGQHRTHIKSGHPSGEIS